MPDITDEEPQGQEGDQTGPESQQVHRPQPLPPCLLQQTTNILVAEALCVRLPWELEVRHKRCFRRGVEHRLNG